MAKITWQVLEDNGGGLYLVVFDSEDKAVGFYTGYEYGDDTLLDDLEYLKSSTHLESDEVIWDMDLPEGKTPQEMYDKLISYQYGLELIADETCVYYDRMGSAGRKAFKAEDYADRLWWCDVCKKIKAMGEFERGFMKISHLDDIYTLEGENCNECGNFIFPIKKTN